MRLTPCRATSGRPFLEGLGPKKLEDFGEQVLNIVNGQGGASAGPHSTSCFHPNFMPFVPETRLPLTTIVPAVVLDFAPVVTPLELSHFIRQSRSQEPAGIYVRPCVAAGSLRAAWAGTPATAGRGLHSFTFQLNVSACCGIVGAFRGC